jgi:hypothetical protein
MLVQAAGCRQVHSESDYGENLFGYSYHNSNPVEWIDGWYSEIDKYDFNANAGTPSNVYEVGHFSQVCC